MAAMAVGGLSAQNQDLIDTTKPLDESALFGGASDLVTVIDTKTAQAGTVSLVDEKKTYPVFILEGDASSGLQGAFVPYGAAASDAQTLFGNVVLSGMSFSFLPFKNATFNVSLDATFLPTGVEDLTAGAYADLRVSEFTRVYASASYNYAVSAGSTSLVTVQDGFSLDELFLDAALGRTLFFRLGKQRVSWGVGNWFKPADVLSLAAIDPDNPTASREGPFAFKVDLPFGLNHATLYTVPPINGNLGEFSVAERTDLIVGAYELSLGAFYRTDWEAKPRLMFMFTGAIGPFDVYGENVVAWGSDRVYAREKTGGGYETYLIENTPVFQSTLGVKYSLSTSDGLGLALHVQGYYNGMGYADSSILQITAARNAIKAYDGTDTRFVSRSGAGMYYLAGSVSLSARFGEGKKITNTSLGGYALMNFSDGSLRFKPSWALSIGSSGNTLDLTLSALTSLGKALSEYAPKGNMITPALSVTLLRDLKLTASVPLYMGSDYVIDKATMDVGLEWNVIRFE
jgi:hypothetical protein